MSRPRRLAISYSRFSDPQQAKGDSENRQEIAFRTFCQRHELTPVREVYIDRGRSGYHDEHRKKGRLGQLIVAVKDGAFESGTVIVVEAWDRLGRLRPDRQIDLLRELLETGVSIGVCRLDDVFSEDDFGTHKWTTLAVFVQLAYQESKQKAERIAASWATRRNKAREDGRPLGCRLPAWLEYVNGTPRLIPERAAAVKRIFRLAADGLGHARIVAALDRDKVPAFGEPVVREGRSRPQFSGRWTRPYVALILNDRRAVGEFQPLAGGKPDGPPLAGHLPAVVSEEEFLLARAGQDRRTVGERGSPRQGRHANVFKGLLRHARDGEGFVLHSKGTAEKPQLVLASAKGVDSRSRVYTFPYPVFEAAILSLLREIDPADVLPRGPAGPCRADVLRARLADARRQVEELTAELKSGFSKALARVLREQEALEEATANELQEELARSARPAGKCWADLPSLVDLLRQAEDPAAARLKLRAVLRGVVEEVWVLTVRRGRHILAAAQVFFRDGGGRRDYLINYRAAGNHSPGGWSARSLSEAIEPGDLDLRQPDHAGRLEAALSALP
jgi:DNA invertase Pin-like site-specific DNA recombinase